MHIIQKDGTILASFAATIPQTYKKCVCGTGGHSKVVLYNFPQSVITTWPTHELVLYYGQLIQGIEAKSQILTNTSVLFRHHSEKCKNIIRHLCEVL